MVLVLLTALCAVMVILVKRWRYSFVNLDHSVDGVCLLLNHCANRSGHG